jgi:type I restriction enzyme M protein
VSDVTATITTHSQFIHFRTQVHATASNWANGAKHHLAAFAQGDHPHALIDIIANQILADFCSTPLVDRYALYQHLMDYWGTVMQDDAYLIAEAGWQALPERVVEYDKRGNARDKGWRCDLVPKPLIVARYYADTQASLDAMQAELERITATISELEEEHGGDEGVFGALDKIAKAEITARVREITRDPDAREELAVLRQWLALSDTVVTLKRQIKDGENHLDAQVYAHYARLRTADIQTLVIDDKWLAQLSGTIDSELSRVSQTLTGRIRLLVERYATPLPQLSDEVAMLEAKVARHLAAMGVVR